MLLRNATLADGRVVDVRISDGVIASVVPVQSGLAATPVSAERAEPAEPAPREHDILDLSEQMLLTPLVEPHAHLDKAFLSERIENPTGDLMGAIVAMGLNRHLISFADTVERAERAVRLMVSNGVALIRTHADVTMEHGMISVEALVEVRNRVAAICDLQIVALVSFPVTGAVGADNRALLRDALAAGADIVGGCPHLDTDPHAANETLLAIAAEFGRDVDLHTDETLNPGTLALEDLACRVAATGFPHRVAASHCVSLGMQSAERQQAVAELVAAAGISVVALPHTNLFLQGRDQQSAMPRALTAVRALQRAGVNVCAGADNLQDPFNPMGRGDPLETAALMVMAAHLLPAAALHAVSGAAHLALTGASGAIVAGAPADLVVISGATVREAMAFAPGGRLVIRSGRVISGDLR